MSILEASELVDEAETQAAPELGPFMRLYAHVTGAVPEILKLCPPEEQQNFASLGRVTLCVFSFQSALYTIAFHQIFALPGEFKPLLLAAGMFLAWFLVEIDARLLRQAFFNSGVQALRDQDIVIDAGFGGRIKGAASFLTRLLWSVNIAQLIGIFAMLAFFAGDINLPLLQAYRKDNAKLFADATSIQVATENRVSAQLSESEKRVNELSEQIHKLRSFEIDPASSDPRIKQAEQDLARLIEEQAQIDHDLRDAEAFETAELAGIKRTPANSGKRGDGAVRQAAGKQVDNMKRHSTEIAQRVDASRKRVDELRSQIQPSVEGSPHHSDDEIATLEAHRKDEEATRDKLKTEWKELTGNRETAIRARVEQSPEHKPFAGGLFSRLQTLGSLSEKEPYLKMMVIVLEIAALGFELSALLSRNNGNNFSKYGALSVRRAYNHVAEVADAMADDLEELERKRRARYERLEAERKVSPSLVPEPQGSGAPLQPPPQPMKRGRGRPRKHPPTVTNGSGQGIPET